MCLLVLEFLTNKFPFFAVISSGLFPHLSPVELAVVCYITLKMMWLKFLITWRFFRLWALADGTLAPENMTRCMSNNNSLETFWRGWHASFNKWIVRYMYVLMLIVLIDLCHGYLSMPCYLIEGSYRVVHWRANVGLLLSYPTIYNIIRHIILISTIATT